MHRFRLLFVLLASLASLSLLDAGTALADGSIVAVTLGTASPPATLGGYTMTPFGADTQALYANVRGVHGPTGDVTFGSPMQHLRVGNGWATWSNGYTGDVYYSNGAASVSLPSGTPAFYLYAEPNPFDPYTITASAQDGTSASATVNGNSGAQFFGFYATGGETIVTVTVTSSIDFAIGEFGIGTAALKAVALPPSGLHVDDSLDASNPVGAFLDPADSGSYQATVDFGAGNGAQDAVVAAAGASCPISNPDGNACFLVLPSAAA